MIRGINSQPYINLEPFLDIDGFADLHYKICKGIVMSEYKKEGNIVKMGGWNNQYDLTWKPIAFAIDEYEALPYDHEIRKIGREIGEWDNRDQFVLFLKLALGAYDPYQFIFLKTEDGGWETRFEEKAWTPDAQHFPELKQWLESLVPTVFTHLGRIIIFKAEHDCIMPLHRDLIYPNETDYFDHRHEFIHLRTNLDKPFYIWDGKDNKILTEHRAIFFNDQDWHAGGQTNKQSYSIRVDGVFSDEFRKNLGIDHLAGY
ncbi:hypothetical protein UFOVP181_183 [uncultured Caudovirales phage]|uniref:Uncharacterized protein n=1 Tax=uncultured Caudovirales phage TaxID=2100421 RepID=A0A6J5KXT8_9CAUD|nr:hypothetical protein UFOVP57_456 [uncultured Caudovirales phage]CAB5208794.1 hypothetical protein UFOVP181_183 [uncultured Caudovirales phage]